MNILIAEDSPEDVRLALEAFRGSSIPNHVSTVSDGEAAMAFLRREAPHQNAPRPDFILLDVHLPKKDGYAVLAEIRADPRLRRIPVIVLSGSRDSQDIARAYDLHANCYIAKPFDVEQYVLMVRSIEQFWSQTATLARE
mgnify:CR=1 FL=1